MTVAVHLPPFGAVKPAISVTAGVAAASLDAEELSAAVDEAVPFCVWKSVTSGSRRL